MIEFEYSLFKLLLLVAVLSARPPGRKWLPLVIAGGFLLAFLPPPVSLPLPWDLLFGLVIPLILWQNSRRIIKVQWSGRWKDVLVWIGSAVIFAVIFWGFKELGLYGAILFGLVTASMIWSVGETKSVNSIVSMIGPFTLIFLLLEVDSLIQTTTRYIGGIFSSLFFGTVIALGAVFLSQKVNTKTRNWITLGQIYLSYGFAAIMGGSVVAASLASVIVFVTVGLYIDLWPYKRVEPAPLNTWPGFIFIMVVFLLLGWQAHYPPSQMFFLEIAVGFVLSMVVAWFGQRLKLEAFPKSLPLWRIGLRATLLLFPALLFWPRQALDQPILLAYALGIAFINFVLVRLTLSYFFE
jgi:hypothetical protein